MIILFLKRSFYLLLIAIIWITNVDTALAENKSFLLTQADSKELSIGQELYLENCTGCHIPIPAQVLPRESWQDILNQPQSHYGQVLPDSVKATAGLIWTYLYQYSRPANRGETIPQYVSNSRYFQALHPKVELPKPSGHQTCSSCHPMAGKLDYRTLSQNYTNQ